MLGDPVKHVFFARVNPELLSPWGPILLGADVERVVAAKDLEAKFVLNEVNARKPVHAMYSATEHFAHEMHFGFKAVLECGRLGLVRAENGVREPRYASGKRVE